MDARSFGVFKERLWGALFDDFAFVDKDDAAGDFFGEVHFVGDDDDSHALVGDFVDEFQNVTNGFWVECGSWFVEE